MKLRFPVVLAAVALMLSLTAAFGAVSMTEGAALPRGQNYDDFSFDYEPAAPYRTFTIFVGGDVETEGFVTVPVGINYLDLFARTGFHVTAGFALTALVDPNIRTLLSGNCLNINIATYEELAQFLGDADVARAIADFIEETGGTDNKDDILTSGILSESEYAFVKYKIFAYK